MENKSKLYKLYLMGVIGILLIVAIVIMIFGSGGRNDGIKDVEIQGMAISPVSTTSNTIFCRDSDGQNYFFKGIVTVPFRTYEDVCTNKTILLERICKNGFRSDELINCVNGCTNGACTCAAGWKCLNNYTAGYLSSSCSWVNSTNCSNGCNNGACIAVVKAVSCIDGGVDTTFKTGTGASYPYSIVYDLKVLSNGKILVGGSFDSFNGVNYANFLRLNNNGSVDLTFNSSQKGQVSSIALQPDGKIIVVSQPWDIKRLNSDGTLDKTFFINLSGGYGGMTRIAHIQTDGKILVAGGYFKISGYYYNSIARFTRTGAFDTSFNPGIGVQSIFNNKTEYGNVFVVKTQSDGKILIGGDFDKFNGTFRNNVARLYSNGSLDTTFNPGVFMKSPFNVSYYDAVNSITIQPDGKILLGGRFNQTVNGVSGQGIIRVNANGSLDTTFRPTIMLKGVVVALYVQPNGKILVLGSLLATYGNSAENYGLVRLNSDGSIDQTFNTGTTNGYYRPGFSTDVGQLDMFGDKIIVGGRGRAIYNNETYLNVVRVNDNCLMKKLDVCVDSDNGLNYFVKGNVTLNGVLVGTDACYNISGINETYCVNNTFLTKFKLCNQTGASYGKCINGACLQLNVTTNTTPVKTGGGTFV